MEAARKFDAQTPKRAEVFKRMVGSMTATAEATATKSRPKGGRQVQNPAQVAARPPTSIEEPARPKHAGGRPRKLVLSDALLEQIEALAKIQCTQKEAAGVLGVHDETFRIFLRDNEKAREAWENGREAGKAALRRNQFKLAMKSAAMAIWLGKQYLGQKDTVELSGDPANPLQFGGKIEIVFVQPNAADESD